MATVRKARKLTNPSKRKRKGRKKLTAKQVKYFGTPAQKAALRSKRRSAGKKAHRKSKRDYGTVHGRSWSRAAPKSRQPKRVSKRKPPKKHKKAKRKNISEIVTFPLAGLGLNPGGKMAGYKKHKKHKEYKAHKKHGGYYKKNNPGYHVHHRRQHNPGLAGMKGMFGDALSIIGGAVATRYTTQLVLRGNNMGVVGYVGNLVSAFVLGWGSGKVFKSAKIGQMVTLGGITALALRLLQDVTPVGKFVNLSLSGLGRGGDIGLGIIVPSSFYTPQVQLPGSMTQFVTPSAISAAIAASAPARSGLRGLGNTYVGRTARGVIAS